MILLLPSVSCAIDYMYVKLSDPTSSIKYRLEWVADGYVITFS